MGLFTKTPTLDLKIEGMTCQNCVRHVTEALEGVEGVRSAKVDLEAKRATIKLSGDPDTPALVAAVEAAGYEATPA